MNSRIGIFLKEKKKRERYSERYGRTYSAMGWFITRQTSRRFDRRNWMSAPDRFHQRSRFSERMYGASTSTSTQRTHRQVTASIARAVFLCMAISMRWVANQTLPFFGMAKSKRPLSASMSDVDIETAQIE